MSNKTKVGFGIVGNILPPQPPANRNPWTHVQLHVLRSVMLSCNNPGQYYRGCLFVCEVFDRLPAEVRRHLDADRRVPPDMIGDLCDNIIRRKLWGLATAYNNTSDPIIEDYSREGLPISFVEAKKFIKKWRDTVRYSQSKLSIEQLARLLGRSTTVEIEKAIKRQGGLCVDTIGFDAVKTNRKELLCILSELCELDIGDERVMEIWSKFNSLLIPH